MRTRNILPAVIIFGSISLIVLAVLLIKGVQQPQNPTPGRAEEGWQHFEDTDQKFFYMDDPNCWKVVTSGSASYHQADHKNPTHPQCGPVVNQWAKFDTTGSGVKFDKFRIGYAPWTYGALINISADGTRINQLNTNNQNIAGKDRKTRVWESSTLPCGEHELELRLDPKQRSGADTIDLDFIEVHTCTPTGEGGGGGGGGGETQTWKQYEDTNPAISYFKPQCWEVKDKANSAPNHPEYIINYRAGTIHQNKNAGTSGCSLMANGDFSTYLATLDLSGSDVNFDQLTVGYRKWTYGPKTENVVVDGNQIGSFNANDSDFNYDFTTQPPWQSPKIACGPHKIELKLGTSGTFGLDFIDVHTCTPSGGGGGGDNGGGGNGGGDNSPAVAEEGGKCQDNPNASARCFDCKKDTEGDQVNILDFSCFAKWYGQDVGKP